MYCGLTLLSVLIVGLALVLVPESEIVVRVDVSNLCLNEEAVLFLQRDQFRRAQKEILDLEDCSYGRKSVIESSTDSDKHRHSLHQFRRDVNTNQFQTDGLFYTHSFGGVSIANASCSGTLTGPKGKRDFSSCPQLGYYIIWKNANEHIRSVLYRYSHNFTDRNDKLMKKPV